ncbi:MAG: serine hydrolase domain-containing protein [Candidatus Thiodiazotropha sp.]
MPKTVEPETVGLSSERLKRIDDLMNRHVEEKKIGGSVVLIARRGEIAYFKTFGNADVEKPIQWDTIFRIASMTKPLVTTAAMLLYEEGRILLTDPIALYIPEFKRPRVLTLLPEGSDPEYKLVLAKREITIRDLMTHKAGITYIFVSDWFKDRKHKLLIDMYKDAGVTDGLCSKEWGIQGMVRRLARLPLIGQPGEVWEYGLSTDVLGYLVEKVSGMKLNDFIRERVLTPLKMNDTYFVVPQEKRARVSAVWESDWQGSLEKMGPGPTQVGGLTVCPGDVHQSTGTYLSGGAGMLSSAYDYYRFSQMLLNKGEIDGVRLLSRKTVELMTATNHIGEFDATFLHSKGWKFGLGFGIQTDRGQEVDSGSKGIYEWAGIYSTRFSVDPVEEKITIMLTQTEPFKHHVDLWDKTLVLSSSAVVD